MNKLSCIFFALLYDQRRNHYKHVRSCVIEKYDNEKEMMIDFDKWIEHQVKEYKDYTIIAVKLIK